MTRFLACSRCGTTTPRRGTLTFLRRTGELLCDGCRRASELADELGVD